MKIKPLAQPYIDFLARFLLYPSLVKFLTAIHENIPRCRQPFMIGNDLTFDVILSEMGQPPGVFGIVYDCDSEAIGARRCGGGCAGSAWSEREKTPYEGQDEAQRN
jgi:hypothetical protein